MGINLSQINIESLDNGSQGFAMDRELQEALRGFEGLVDENGKIDLSKLDLPDGWTVESVEDALNDLLEMQALITDQGIKNLTFMDEVEYVEDLPEGSYEKGSVVRERSTNSFKYWNGERWVQISSGMIKNASKNRDGLMRKEHYGSVHSMYQYSKLVDDIEKVSTDFLTDGKKSKVLTNVLYDRIMKAIILEDGEKIPYTYIGFDEDGKVSFFDEEQRNLVHGRINGVVNQLQEIIKSKILSDGKVVFTEVFETFEELLSRGKDEILKIQQEYSDKMLEIQIVAWVEKDVSYYLIELDDEGRDIKEPVKILTIPKLSINPEEGGDLESDSGILSREDYIAFKKTNELFRELIGVDKDGELEDKNFSEFRLVKDVKKEEKERNLDTVEGYHYVAGHRGRQDVSYFRVTNRGTFTIESISEEDLTVYDDDVEIGISKNLISGTFQLQGSHLVDDREVTLKPLTFELKTSQSNGVNVEIQNRLQEFLGDEYVVRILDGTNKVNSVVFQVTTVDMVERRPKIKLRSVKNDFRELDIDGTPNSNRLFLVSTEKVGIRPHFHGLRVKFSEPNITESVLKYRFKLTLNDIAKGKVLINTNTGSMLTGSLVDGRLDKLLNELSTSINSAIFKDPSNTILDGYGTIENGYLLHSEVVDNELYIRSKVSGLKIEFALEEINGNEVEIQEVSDLLYTTNNLKDSPISKEELIRDLGVEDDIEGSNTNTLISGRCELSTIQLGAINNAVTETFVMNYTSQVSNTIISDSGDLIVKTDDITTSEIRRMVLSISAEDSKETILNGLANAITASNTFLSSTFVPNHNEEITAKVNLDNETVTITTKAIPRSNRKPSISFENLNDLIILDIDEDNEAQYGITQKANYWEEPLKVGDTEHGEVKPEDIIKALDRLTLINELDNANDFFTKLYTQIINQQVEGTLMSEGEFEDLAVRFIRLFNQFEGVLDEENPETVAGRLDQIEELLRTGVSPEGSIRVTGLKFSGEDLDPTFVKFDDYPDFEGTDLDPRTYTVSLTMTSNPEGAVGEYWVEKHEEHLEIHNTGFGDAEFDITITYPLRPRTNHGGNGLGV